MLSIFSHPFSSQYAGRLPPLQDFWCPPKSVKPQLYNTWHTKALQSTPFAAFESGILLPLWYVQPSLLNCSFSSFASVKICSTDTSTSVSSVETDTSLSDSWSLFIGSLLLSAFWVASFVSSSSFFASSSFILSTELFDNINVPYSNICFSYFLTGQS